jgi:hypothetical protein
MNYSESKKAVGISHFPPEEEAERQKRVIEPSHIKAQTFQRTQTKGSPLETRQQGRSCNRPPSIMHEQVGRPSVVGLMAILLLGMGGLLFLRTRR